MSQCRIVFNTDQEEESQDDSYLQVTDDDGKGETLVTVRWPPTMAIKTGAGDLIQQKLHLPTKKAVEGGKCCVDDVD